MDFLQSLNLQQAEAVLYGQGPMLILAGAGSGKTRVLTHRIASLIQSRQVDPSQIFAVTFTNKAAAEMRGRVYELLRLPEAEDMWISTFHSACVRFLRSHIHHLGYQTQFTIYDDTDQKSVIKAAMKELNVSEGAISPKAIQAKINKLKNDGLDHLTYRPNFGGPIEDAFIRVFERYAEALEAASAVDFADLILLTVRLFKEQPQVLSTYQKRFTYLMIDEYQDTNKCQYQLMRLLAGPTANLCAVGDEDQSIYRWRGADISNILNFEKDYPSARIFKLEQNYRSTKNIIEAASHVISHNTERRDKKLWTGNETGEKIRVFETYDEHDEASKVADIVKENLRNNCGLNQMAVFYRTNAQSRLLEDRLRGEGINYEIYGGLKFYSRLEVKDALGYLRLVANPDDDVSFRRVINVPGRGIGKVSLDKFSAFASREGVSHYGLLSRLFGKPPSLNCDLGRAHKKFLEFYQLIESFRAEKQNLLPSDLLTHVLEESGYRKSLVQENTIEAQSRLENLAELQQSLVEFELRKGANQPNERATLEEFLEQIALVTDFDKYDPEAPALKMMTIHTAKGLEFDVVLIVGLEEELFPNFRPWEGEDASDLEEERRLFYVGMTRARQRLYLLYAKNRTVFGSKNFRVMSRFIEEIPQEYTDFSTSDFFERRKTYLDRSHALPKKRSWEGDDYSQVPVYDSDFSDSQTTEDGIRVGSRIVHSTFGEGVVRQMIGKDKMMVRFALGGEKKISVKFGQITLVSP